MESHIFNLREYWGISISSTLHKIADEINEESYYYAQFNNNRLFYAVKRKIIDKKIKSGYKWVKLN